MLGLRFYLFEYRHKGDSLLIVLESYVLFTTINRLVIFLAKKNRVW
jgi:hypothetical protein